MQKQYSKKILQSQKMVTENRFHIVQHKSLKTDRVSIIWVKTHRIFTSTDECSVQPVANERQKALLETVLIREGIHTKTNNPLSPVSFSGIMEEIIKQMLIALLRVFLRDSQTWHGKAQIKKRSCQKKLEENSLLSFVNKQPTAVPSQLWTIFSRHRPTAKDFNGLLFLVVQNILRPHSF